MREFADSLMEWVRKHLSSRADGILAGALRSPSALETEALRSAWHRIKFLEVVEENGGDAPMTHLEDRLMEGHT